MLGRRGQFEGAADWLPVLPLWGQQSPAGSGIVSEPAFDIASDTIRYDTVDDLHWKTDRQAASLI